MFDKVTHPSFLEGTGRLPAWLIGPDRQLLGGNTMRTLLPSEAAWHRAVQPMRFLLWSELTPDLPKTIDPNLRPLNRCVWLDRFCRAEVDTTLRIPPASIRRNLRRHQHIKD